MAWLDRLKSESVYSCCIIIVVTNQIEAADHVNMYAVQLTEISGPNI